MGSVFSVSPIARCPATPGSALRRPPAIKRSPRSPSVSTEITSNLGDCHLQFDVRHCRRLNGRLPCCDGSRRHQSPPALDHTRVAPHRRHHHSGGSGSDLRRHRRGEFPHDVPAIAATTPTHRRGVQREPKRRVSCDTGFGTPGGPPAIERSPRSPSASPDFTSGFHTVRLRCDVWWNRPGQSSATVL